MKIVKKLGLIGTSVIITLKALALKAYATYGHIQSDYGVYLEPQETRSTFVIDIISNIIVPIVLLIGLIIFFKKSASSMMKKVIVSIGTVLAYILFRIIIKNVF